MKRISYFILAACALLCGSCAEEAVEDHIVTKLDGDPYEQDDISIWGNLGFVEGEEANSYIMNLTEETLEWAGQIEGTFYFTCRKSSWKITNIPSWLTVTPSEGKPSLDNIEITCVAERNMTGETRYGTMYLDVNGKRFTINIVQDGPTFANEVEPVSGVHLSGLKYEGGNRFSLAIDWIDRYDPVYIKSKYDWEFIETPDWIELEPNSGKGSDEWLEIKVKPADTAGETRKGTAMLKVADEILEIEISKDGWL